MVTGVNTNEDERHTIRQMIYICIYETRDIDDTITLELQMFMWEAIDRMPEPKDYLQVFRLSVANVLQVVEHTSEQPEYKTQYILAEVEKTVTAKVYVIDSEQYCTMLLAEEY